MTPDQFSQLLTALNGIGSALGLIGLLLLLMLAFKDMGHK